MAIAQWREEKAFPIVLGVENGHEWAYRLLTPWMPASEPEIGDSGGRSQSPRLWQNTVALAKRLEGETDVLGDGSPGVVAVPLLSDKMPSWPSPVERMLRAVVAPVDVEAG
ncbi:hypothetical protein [Cupriavidus pauculus]|uniref:hypothetical protein n=1 Tax=Cupriavidus pauculus TaxID=82633 RepID=UPI0007853247|nr:hypothetical protein [Cupriavidus pauculus]